MLENMINNSVDTLYKKLIRGVFHIGLDPIKEYIKFYIIAEFVQKELLGESISILSYTAENCELTDKTEGINDSDRFEQLERKDWNVYERKIDHYNNLNFEKKIELLKRQHKEKKYRELHNKKKVAGSAIRYNGNKIHRFQFSEFKILDVIKGSSYEFYNAKKTYKRIISDKGYLCKMNFEELKNFIEILTQEIDESKEEYKNIRYYKLEYRMNFELIKSVLSALHKYGENFEIDSIVLNDLIRLFKLPLIKERQIYAELYPTLDVEEQMIWRIEIDNLFWFINESIKKIKQELNEVAKEDIIKTELEAFKNIYKDFKYKNSYKIRKDFTSKEFKTLMKSLDEINVKEHNKVENIYKV